MKQENQLTSIKTSEILNKLGVNQESYFYWVKSPDSKVYMLMNCAKDGRKNLLSAGYKVISAFSATELGIRAMGIIYGIRKNGISWARIDMEYYSKRRWSEGDTATEIFTDKNEAEARAKLRIYLIENKLL